MIWLQLVDYLWLVLTFIICDQFQVGRFKGPVIDFVVRAPPNKTEKPVEKPCRFRFKSNLAGDSGPQPRSTVSRFSCRIDIERQPPHAARIYAAGFDTQRNIFLGVSYLSF